VRGRRKRKSCVGDGKKKGLQATPSKLKDQNDRF
jgi:hypothetical protein